MVTFLYANHFSLSVGDRGLNIMLRLRLSLSLFYHFTFRVRYMIKAMMTNKAILPARSA